MSISKLEVKQILNLSKLSSTQDELEILCSDLNNLAMLFSNIHNINTENVPPMTSPLTQNTRLREDIAEKQNLQTHFPEYCSQYEKEHFIVPSVLDTIER